MTDNISSETVSLNWGAEHDAPIKLTALAPKQRQYLEELYRPVSLKEGPNGCFVLTKQHPGHSVAAALPVGFTSWKGHEHNSIDLAFFRAPDSGYTLYLTVSDDTVHGVGRFWSGNGPEAQLPPDSVTGRRIGAPDPALCINAAKLATVK